MSVERNMHMSKFPHAHCILCYYVLQPDISGYVAILFYEIKAHVLSFNPAVYEEGCVMGIS